MAQFLVLKSKREIARAYVGTIMNKFCALVDLIIDGIRERKLKLFSCRKRRCNYLFIFLLLHNLFGLMMKLFFCYPSIRGVFSLFIHHLLFHVPPLWFFKWYSCAKRKKKSKLISQRNCESNLTMTLIDSQKG